MERYKNTWKSLGKSHKNAQLSPQLYHVRSKSFSRILTQQQFSLEDAVVVVVVVVLVVVVVVVRLVVVAVVVVVVVVVHSRATILVFVVIVDSRSTVQQSSFLRRVTTAWIQEIRRRFGPRLHFAAAQQQVREQPEQRNTRRNHEYRLPSGKSRCRIVDHADNGGSGKARNGGDAVGNPQQNAGVLRGDVQMVAVEPGKIGTAKTRGAD